MTRTGHIIKHRELSKGNSLSQISPRSAILRVNVNPISAVAWGLREKDEIHVLRVRTEMLGNNPVFIKSEDCCGSICPPDDVVIGQWQPYKRLCKSVILTAENPTAIIDDVGNFIFEYRGSTEASIELFKDTLPRKPFGCCQTVSDSSTQTQEI